MTSDPVRAAWAAAGHPAPPPGGRRSAGPCARCSTVDELETTSRVVSDRFTGWDSWADPSGTGLCPACAWAYREPQLRKSSIVVRRDPPGIEFVDLTGLRKALAAPVPAGVAVVATLNVGRKHVLPSAEFGRVCVDGVVISWSDEDVKRLAIMEELRRAGVSYLALAEPAPPWKVIAALPAAGRARLLELWDRLDPWRQARPWFDLGVSATTFAAKR